MQMMLISSPFKCDFVLFPNLLSRELLFKSVPCSNTGVQIGTVILNWCRHNVAAFARAKQHKTMKF